MDHISLFATPVLVFQLDGMDAVNQELAERLTGEAARRPGLARSNVGGWHSVPDLSQRREPCFQALMQAVVDCAHHALHEVARATGARVPPLKIRQAVHAWAMVMRDGDYTILHDHAESHWSTAYYVDAGDADAGEHPASGTLAFVDPRRAGTTIDGIDLFPSTFTVRPRTGMLVVFPGWLQHYVHPYRGSRPRISISCNIHMDLVGLEVAG